MNDIRDLEDRLHSANERLQRATKALAPKHRGGEWQEFDEAYQVVLSLERELAAAKGEEYAIPCDFPVKWDRGAPLPQLIVNEHRAFLAFRVSEPDPAWDGSYITTKSSSDGLLQSLALVEFERCVSAKLGSPNDEVFNGHPLFGKGIQGYTAQRVCNSRWLREIETINSVHFMYRPEFWRDLKHFIFWFHDSTYECIARSYKVETHRVSMKDLLGMMAQRFISQSA